MITRRDLLRGVPLLLALPRASTAAPHWWAPTQHWLNHPRLCLAWFLASERQSGHGTWVDLMARQQGTLVNMGKPPSVLSGLQRLTTRRGGWGALRFQASAQTRITVPGVFGTQPQVTLSCWARFDTAPSGTNQYSAISLGDSVGLVLHGGTTNSNRPRGFFYNGSTWPVTQPVATGGYNGTGWHHWAYTCQPGAVQRLYLDGRALVTTTLGGTLTYGLGSQTVLGGHGNGGTTVFYTGDLDDVRVFRVALDAPAVQILYLDSLTGYPRLLLQDESDRVAPAFAAPVLTKGPSLFFGQ